MCQSSSIPTVWFVVIFEWFNAHFGSETSIPYTKYTKKNTRKTRGKSSHKRRNYNVPYAASSFEMGAFFKVIYVFLLI